MFVFILLLTCVRAEWVEISQYHIEKPLRIQHKPPLKLIQNDQSQKIINEEYQKDVTENFNRKHNEPSSIFSENKTPSLKLTTTEINLVAINKHKIRPENDSPSRIYGHYHPKLSGLEELEVSTSKHKIFSSKPIENKEPLQDINKTSSQPAENRTKLRESQRFSSNLPSTEKPLDRKSTPIISETKNEGIPDENDKNNLSKDNNKEHSNDKSHHKVFNTRRKGFNQNKSDIVLKIDGNFERDKDKLDIAEKGRIYMNDSLSYNFNKGTIKKVPKFGNVQRVRVDDSTEPARTLDDREKYKNTDNKHFINHRYKVGQDNALIQLNDANKNGHDLIAISDPEQKAKNEDKSTPIEVLNLSDVEYGSDKDVFPIIDISDDIIEVDSVKDIKKHFLAKIPTKLEHINEFDEKAKKVKNQSELKEKVLKTQNSESALEKNNITSNLPETSTLLETKKYIDSQDDINKKYKTDTGKFTLSGNNKTFVPVMRITIPDPEEVMIKEILEAESNIKRNNDLNSNTETIKGYNGNKDTRATPLSKIVLSKSDRRAGIVKKITQYQPNLQDGISKTSNFNSNVIEEGVKDKYTNELTNETKSKNINKDISISKSKDTKNQTIVAKELASIYMNENVEIIRQVQVTSTEEIPLRTTIKIKPLKYFKNKGPQETGPDDLTDTYYPTDLNKLSKSQQDFNTKLSNKNKEKEADDQPRPIGNILSPTQRTNDITVNTTLEGVVNNAVNDTKNRIVNVKESMNIDYDNIKDDKVKFNESITEDANLKTMKNLVKFLKVVTDTISKNTKQSLKGKLRYLEDLRDTIMANIEHRIDALFPDDSESGRRRSRSAQARGHHVEFPSSEGALMTISFLTFAVFLIKLVMQVVHTYKNKTMMMPTVVAAVGRAVHNYHTSNSK